MGTKEDNLKNRKHRAQILDCLLVNETSLSDLESAYF
jgi:hypothetical protein